MPPSYRIEQWSLARRFSAPAAMMLPIRGGNTDRSTLRPLLPFKSSVEAHGWVSCLVKRATEMFGHLPQPSCSTDQCLSMSTAYSGIGTPELAMDIIGKEPERAPTLICCALSWHRAMTRALLSFRPLHMLKPIPGVGLCLQARRWLRENWLVPGGAG